MNRGNTPYNTRSSRSITLVLVTAGLAALGFTAWHAAGRAPTTQSSNSHGGSRWWFGRSYGGSYGGSHGSSSIGHTSRGGFGSSGHSVSS